MRRFIVFVVLISLSGNIFSLANATKREKILFNHNWRFALGHATNVTNDFNHATAYFSYFAKTGYGDGPAAENFDDRAWRVLDLPHDWCVELPFDSRGTHSHGYKAIGTNFPENSIGWYRKKFFIPATDLGKKIFIHFEGVHRDARVWVNGFYCGRNHSGYYPFEYDITDYLNYGGDNVVVVRADATMQEGWYYEGAGIYRNVFLIKTHPLHIKTYGTNIVSTLFNNYKTAKLTIGTTVVNKNNTKQRFLLHEKIFDDKGQLVVEGKLNNCELKAGEEKEWITNITIQNPKLWSLETPNLYCLISQIIINDSVVDEYVTNFGIRSIRFCPDSGFFLNGKHLKIKGTNNHQDHAGVGTAIPDALQVYRVKKLKEMGSNAIRTSHNPPTPALLEACDKLGMLVLNENRLMGSNEEHLNYLKTLIIRDRNHPSVIIWSLGNEEWAIEGNDKGIRIATTMQQYASRIDSTRPITAACSGGWDTGTGTILQLMGYNYLVHGNIDEHHRKFPWQPAVGTEESNTIGTRGVYHTNEEIGHMAPTSLGTEIGWKYYYERPFLAGLFYWTGFDYRGEPNPMKWPAISSQYGILDLCGFPKDIFYYLKAWWTNEPVLHISPHWNWKGMEGNIIEVTVYSNCDEVELILNGKSQGRKVMPFNSHLKWKITYNPGYLLAIGYKNGKKIITKKIETTSNATQLLLKSDKSILLPDKQDVAVVDITALDAKKRIVPDANNQLYFEVNGPARIIGVGNGNPSSHEKDRFIENIRIVYFNNLKEFTIDNLNDTSYVGTTVNDDHWIKAFTIKHKDWQTYIDTLLTVRAKFELPDFDQNTIIHLFSKSILENQSIYINGHCIAKNIMRDDPNQSFLLDHKILKKGANVIAFTGQRFKKRHQWDEPNTDPGLIRLFNHVPQWKRKLFNGHAQVIIQSIDEQGEVSLKIYGDNIKPAEIKLTVKK